MGRKGNPGKQHSEGVPREDAYDEGSTSSSSLSSLSSLSLSSQSEFEVSEEEEEEEDEEEDEEGVTVSRYFQRPVLSAVKAKPEIKKRKRTITVVKKEPAVAREDTERKPTPPLGDIVPAIIKHERKKKGKKVISTEPPPHWEEMYDAVKEMRSRIPAPVDTMGCERLADRASTPKVFFLSRITQDRQYLTWKK